jgi:hypothetical protein
MNGGTNIHLPTILSYCLCPGVLTRSRVFLSNLPNLYQTCLYQTYLCKTYLHPTLLYQTHLDQIGFYPHSIHPIFLYETCPYQTYLFQTQLQIPSKSTLSNFSSSSLPVIFSCHLFLPVCFDPHSPAAQAVATPQRFRASEFLGGEKIRVDLRIPVGGSSQ